MWDCTISNVGVRLPAGVGWVGSTPSGSDRITILADHDALAGPIQAIARKNSAYADIASRWACSRKPRLIIVSAIAGTYVLPRYRRPAYGVFHEMIPAT